ncbi:MAG: AraC family transcriptional regulator [Spirochaetales bacterium]|nr:AraC family transcriptional regulator [Spirochaetales bacterium]
MALYKTDLFFHTEYLPRRFPAGQEIQSVGYYPGKKEWIRRRFDTMNFSLILSGRGFYEDKGRLTPIQAPAVITQSPGQRVNYGPDSQWEELFLIYPPGSEEYFRRRQILGSPLWKIHRPGEVLQGIQDMVSFLRSSSGTGVEYADILDLNLEKLLMVSSREPPSPRETELQVFVQQLLEKMEMNCSADYDFHRLAEERGFSPSSFRRCWEEIYTTPPGQSLIQIRIRKASRLLAETDLSVKRIALDLGYEDPLYFSRLFRKKQNESPLSYRKRTRAPYLTDSGT